MKKSLAKLFSAIILVMMIATFPKFGGVLKANAQGVNATLELNDQWVDGTITTYNGIDYYTVTTSSAGWLTISIQGRDISNCDCELLNSDGYHYDRQNVTKSATKTATYAVEKRQYKIQVTGKATGAYRLKASFKPAENNEVEPNNVFSEAMNLDENQVVTGFISIDDRTDFYKINIPTKRKVIITVVNKIGSYNNISLWDKDFQKKFSQDIIRGSEESPQTLKKEIDLEAGQYYIKAEDNGSDKELGRYDIKWETAPTPVESITIKGKKSVEEGAELKLSATILPDNATNKTLKWSTSNKKVATVDENGLVTGVKAGKVTITASATDDSKVSATYEVTVKKPNVKKVETLKATSKKGKKVALTWKKQKSAKKYQIQIAKDKKFKTYLVDTTTKNNKNKFTLKYELKGTAYVRVRAISKNGGKGAWSKTVSVKVK